MSVFYDASPDFLYNTGQLSDGIYLLTLQNPRLKRRG